MRPVHVGTKPVDSVDSVVSAAFKGSWEPADLADRAVGAAMVSVYPLGGAPRAVNWVGSPPMRYRVNEGAVTKAHQLIDAHQYVLRSEWNRVQPTADDQNHFLDAHTWADYSSWHLGLTEGANDETKARYAFVFGDFRRIHRMGIIACHYRAAEWGHKEIELAAHDLLQRLDASRS
jgi:hypothetical protein